jgi:heme exporter protein CcmD
MDMSSAHTPYIIASYSLVIIVFISLTYWVLREDRKVRQQLAKLKSDAT